MNFLGTVGRNSLIIYFVYFTEYLTDDQKDTRSHQEAEQFFCVFQKLECMVFMKF